MESDDVNHWFGEYLDAFAACGRGESETASLFEYYGVPLLITTGDGFYAPTPGEQVAAGMQPQVDGMRAARATAMSSTPTFPERHVPSLPRHLLAPAR